MGSGQSHFNIYLHKSGEIKTTGVLLIQQTQQTDTHTPKKNVSGRENNNNNSKQTIFGIRKSCLQSKNRYFLENKKKKAITHTQKFHFTTYNLPKLSIKSVWAMYTVRPNLNFLY